MLGFSEYRGNLPLYPSTKLHVLFAEGQLHTCTEGDTDIKTKLIKKNNLLMFKHTFLPADAINM